ncbi:hypothetical protein ES288_D13G028700v1 [Gossypium darwinii]|uniref:Methyltransferase type 11 domain-containing protein n=1 Tax=Gossypium darwinii TaxID=34276 RepID=A0A5D1ZV71_GOSDA|nr:hypothetical protein ES288_D13G028700v1 [Gossypium darwinii]
MDFKTFNLMIFHGSLGRRVLLRALMVAAALSVVPLLQIISGAGPDILYTLSASASCAIGTGSPTSTIFPGKFLFSKVWRSFGPVQCEENKNLTTSVVKELMEKQILSYNAKALCVGEGSMSAVRALKDLGFSDVTGAYRHPCFSLKHKKFVYELDYEDNSYDFVISRDLDKVSAPAMLVLEVERVLTPGGIGSMLVGRTGSLISSVTPVSSLLKASSVVHVDYVNGFALIVFKKKLKNGTYFEQYRLPADCRSMANTKPMLDNIEPLLEKRPVGFEKTIAYLPEFHLNSNVTDWFLPSYPVDRKAFHVYFIDHNTSVMLSYVNKPGINFVYYPSLAGNRATSNSKASIGSDDSDPYVEDEGFDFLLWIKETMNAGEVELKTLSDLFESGTICSIDELFLHCSNRAVNRDWMDLFKSLRGTGVYVHQWWGDQ